MSFSHQTTANGGATALLALTFCVAGAHLALAQSRDPIRTVVPILIDTTTGNITVGSTTYQGRNPGMNMVALKRQPGTNPELPDLVNQPMVVTDSNSANSFLQNVLQNSPDALMIVNATWNYSFKSIFYRLQPGAVWKQQPY